MMRYDLRRIVVPASNEPISTLIDALKEFVTMLRKVDASIIVYPWQQSKFGVLKEITDPTRNFPSDYEAFANILTTSSLSEKEVKSSVKSTWVLAPILRRFAKISTGSTTTTLLPARSFGHYHFNARKLLNLDGFCTPYRRWIVSS